MEGTDKDNSVIHAGNRGRAAPSRVRPINHLEWAAAPMIFSMRMDRHHSAARLQDLTS